MSSKNSKTVQRKRGIAFSPKKSTLQLTAQSGPLPSPEILANYNQILPEAAERIFLMAEQQAKHRQSVERSLIEGNISSEKRGQWFAFLLVFICILVGGFLIYSGKDGIGFATIISAIMGSVGIFVYGKYAQRKGLSKSKSK